MLAVSLISSLGGMTAAVSAPVAAIALGAPQLLPWLAGIAAIVLFQHRENIARLLKGQEPRVGSKS